MKRFVVTCFLIMFFAFTHCVVYAGLDTSTCLCTLITVFRFETTQFDVDNQVTYTVGAKPQDYKGALLNGATLSDKGKDGKCLHLRGDDSFGCGTTFVPTLANAEYAIAAWIRLPRQQQGTLYFHLSGRKNSGGVGDFMVFRVKKDGNLAGLHVIGNRNILVETEKQNVSDNQWHHITYTKYLDTYYIYVDGQPIIEKFEEINPLQRIFSADATFMSIASFQGNLTGNVYVDDFVMLSIGLSPYEVKGLYEDGITTFMEAMPVNPQGRLATTWGAIKAQQ